MECDGKSIATDRNITVQSAATLEFVRKATLGIQATIAWSSSQSKDLSLVTELTNNGPSDADGIVCEISYPSDLIPNPKSLGNCTAAKDQPVTCKLDNVAGS